MTTQYVLFSDYNSATTETVATFLPLEASKQLYQLMNHYKSEKSHPYQFIFTDKVSEKPMYLTNYDLRQDRALGIRREWVDGELKLPKELLSENPTPHMLSLLTNGGIVKFFQQ